MKILGTMPLGLLAALALAAPAVAQEGSQRFPSRAEEQKAQQEKERQAEEKAAREKQATPPKVVTSDAEARTVAEKAAQFEKAYRDRAARIDRLIAVYEKKGDQARVDELRLMRERLDKRHENAMQGFKAQLGENRWARVEKHFKGPSARALEVRNERANENAAERDARKAEKAREKEEKRGDPPPKKPE